MDNNDLTSSTLKETETQPNNSKRKLVGNIIFYSVIGLCLLITITSILLNQFVFIRVRVYQSSMENTLFEGDVLLANKLKECSRGDIVIIKSTGGDDKLIIKRVIGLGGDTIKIEDGFVYRNGELLNEPYVYERKIENVDEFTVEEGKVYYLGDHRKVSIDSRLNGTCDLTDIVGVVSEFSLKIKGITTFITNVFSFEGCSK